MRKGFIRLCSTFFISSLVACGGGSGGSSGGDPEANQEPVFTSDAIVSTLDNRLETGYQAMAIDNDGDPITFTISGGVDGLDFLVNSESGVLSFQQAPDFENPHDDNTDNIYEIELSAADNKGGASQLNLAITVSGNSIFLTIPVVVHVLFLNNTEHQSNISEDKILSQLVVLNQDYRKNNADLANVPEEFVSVIADTEIEFVLANLDPDGEPTNGITRTLDLTESSEAIHFTNSGGHDAWPTKQYLNIWVHDGADRNGNVAVGGSGQFPGGDPLTDGVIVDYRVIGTIEPLLSNNNFHLGRTTTHEIGHWLNLRHISAGDSCDKDDDVDDTPNAIGDFPLFPTYPLVSCGSSDMFMNFMAPGVNDADIVMFTEGQKARIHAVFAPGGGRAELYDHLVQD